ncbi:MAG: 23S rRNA (pseudouridine(1915)-N(3))-methyltransferase RlmH [Bacteroidetes bacterium]|nr:MAG: 23S rRNA (pseudouridine(1915)-N(3))-methyltransferase RlmH [Bacteroidota bacterium]
MKIDFIAIGKPHDASLQIAIAEFTKRLQHYASVQWHIIASPKKTATAEPEVQKREEAKVLLAALEPTDWVILLDERGKLLNSVQLAQQIEKWQAGSKKLVFIIGGAFGVHEQVMQRANIIWSLSNLVFPHMIVRLLLAEQVYRAYTIIHNEKYHHV